MSTRVWTLERVPESRRNNDPSLPRRRGPRWRGFPRWRIGIGKLIGRSPSAAVTNKWTRPAKLGLVTDALSRRRCLLDTGSQVSLWPPLPTTSQLQQSSVRLTAANGTAIKSFGHHRREIKNGGKSYTFLFLNAQVPRPILGLDFLQTFGMMLDLRLRRLIHGRVSTRFAAASSPISGVNAIQSSSFARLLSDFPEITDASRASCSSNHDVECYIPTTGPPVKTAPRRLTPERLKVAKKYFELMCTAGICRHSESAWSSGLHMVQKKYGRVHPCGDYQRLNERTTGDTYPIPHVHDFTAGLAGCWVFSKIDLVKGYHQVPVRKEDIPKTAIATPFGLFEFIRMPFGLKNSAQTFQRLMDSVTGQLNGVFV